MNRSTILKRLLLAPPTVRSSLLTHQPIYHPSVRSYSSIQSITQPSFWASLVPKPLRKNNRTTSQTSKPRSKEWNPATFFIFLFLLIGSMSIQMIALKNTHEAFERRASAKTGLLREVIERIQKGEDVDVEGLLGTGDEKREKEWEEVLQEIEREDQAMEISQRQRKPSKQSPNPLTESETPNSDRQPMKAIEEKTDLNRPRSNAPRGFY